MSVLATRLIAFATITLIACSNSEPMGFDTEEGFATTSDTNTTVTGKGAHDTIKEYLPLDDTEYPYAGIPRIVIETENRRAIKDRETEIPAKLQIWGEKAPESDIMDLTIRGRGNTSWADMPKKSYKIEFSKKQAILGMPEDRDWALIANYADKTLMKNYLAYHLAASLDFFYTPKCDFVELYLNKEYLGVYLLTETIKISPNRINIPKNSSSYLIEIDERVRDNELKFYSFVIKNDSIGKGFHIHSPKNISESSYHIIEKHILEFETYLKKISSSKENNINQWIDINEYIKHYWMQEFSKNTDANFFSSIYFTWQNGDVIKMGPVWDFDLAFGGSSNKNIATPQDWRTKKAYWNAYLFKDSTFSHGIQSYWIENKEHFSAILHTIDSLNTALQDAQKNNFKRWKVLSSTELSWHRYAYNSYNEAVEDLKNWINLRISWIDSQLTNHKKTSLNTSPSAVRSR